MGPIERVLQEKLSGFLGPSHLELTNESPKHGLPPEAEKHFRLVVVSEHFANSSRLERHRLVHQILQTELNGLVHALSVQAFTADEWRARGAAGHATPDCLHAPKS